MLAGSVDRTTINGATGAAGTSSGAAGTVYAWLVAYYAGLATPQPAPLPVLGSTANPFSAERPCEAGDIASLAAGNLAQYKFWADMANMGGQFIAYILANGHAHVTIEQLGELPSPLTVGTPIAAPAAPVDIPIT